MIPLNELKRNNYVSFINKEGETQIDSVVSILDDGSVYTKNYEFRHDFDDLKPIPLTPEILIACGFKRNEKRGTHVIDFINSDGAKKTLFIGTDENSMEKPFMFYGLFDHVTFDSVIIEKIPYLHQLQNLYFALTGKELIYSLNSLTGSGSTFSKKTV